VRNTSYSRRVQALDGPPSISPSDPDPPVPPLRRFQGPLSAFTSPWASTPVSSGLLRSDPRIEGICEAGRMGAGIRPVGREGDLVGSKLGYRTGGNQGRHREDRLHSPSGPSLSSLTLFSSVKAARIRSMMPVLEDVLRDGSPHPYHGRLDLQGPTPCIAHVYPLEHALV